MVFDKLKIKSKGGDLKAVSVGDKPTKRQIYQSRNNYGVNLGACFVNEKWIFDELFEDGADFELQAAKNAVKKHGKDDARKKFESHWQNFMNNDDWKWLQDHQVTSVRIPIGYWEIDGGNYTSGTKFHKNTDVYTNAWSIFKKDFIELAAKVNISVLVDVHGLPGGANGSDHSGEKSSGSADFWGDQSAQRLMLSAFKFIAKDLKKYDNIAGIQIVNESEWSDDGKRQKQYYAAALNLIREEDSDIPVIISDGWNPHQWVHWIQEKQDKTGPVGFVVDHHVYRCFSDDDKKKSPQQIIKDLDGDVLTNLNQNGRGVDFMVGEYSCVIDGQSWDKDNANSQRDQLVIDYGKKQCEVLCHRATYGSYFWTYKFQSGNGGEWDFKTMSDKGAISCALGAKGKSAPDDGKYKSIFEKSFEDHKNYWDKANSKEKYEHDRYKAGFEQAWKDSQEFFKFDHSLIGRKQTWKLMRLQQHISSKGSLKHLWEFEQGYDAGVDAFRSAL